LLILPNMFRAEKSSKVNLGHTPASQYVHQTKGQVANSNSHQPGYSSHGMDANKHSSNNSGFVESRPLQAAAAAADANTYDQDDEDFDLDFDGKCLYHIIYNFVNFKYTEYISIY
jgi:hypothetical protein